MSLLDRFARFDSSLQRGLDNGFALIFGGKVVPAEVEELLKQEAQDNLTSHGHDRVLAPNVFVVGVSSKDLENLSQNRELPERFADQLARFGRNQGWEYASPPVVRIAEESGLHTGQMRVSSFVDAHPEEGSGFDAIDHELLGHQDSPTTPAPDQVRGTDYEVEDSMDESYSAYAPTEVTHRAVPRNPVQDEPARESGPAVTLLLQDGSSRTYHVHEGSNIIGRSNDSDLRLPDTGVSRQHAEITWDGTDAVLVDLESTNGTNVNDTQVDNWLLADGDVITVGHSHIEVRITGTQSR
ncbi:DUF3662 and FHA domain-containing protein [Corynebacterium tapiri]|uniref:DUF2662 domain-containing protein n=1 Tax=Corynebacterium tapiri TaxID=1448266 RepID=A0A5C4U2P0_9CORY|nr:DUF3662 and FHA domain-containing protein [Corynebacterium tapiri]TNL96834.1 DUF2662 domain-containing protein [Corynebacterium tapiri]